MDTGTRIVCEKLNSLISDLSIRLDAIEKKLDILAGSAAQPEGVKEEKKNASK